MSEMKTPNLLPFHPKDLSNEEFSIYEAEFKTIFSDPLCRNIALSGPYGAGKSSVIEKTKKERKGFGEKWITISLATFNTSNDKKRPNNRSNQEAIEAEILRQMIHKIGVSKAPKTKLRKLRDRDRFIDAIISILILAFVLLTVYLANVSDRLISLQPSYIDSFAFAAWLIIVSISLYLLIRTNVISKVIKRIKIFETELEITPSDSKSPYERCIDEIVYLLNASKIDTVVFEDLDRFNSVDIFEKMRNLNNLANDSRLSDTGKNKKVKPLRFFFLVRDGLFKNPHDRTKFFDYVIPIVPYTDPNNALAVMRNALSGVGISVDEGFLYQLSLHIGDPRIIYDITNEAYHYKKTLFEKRSFAEGDPEHLVAILTYKALFPGDFELLQAGRGYLYEVLNGKQRLLAKLEENNEAKKVDLQNELNDIEHQLKTNEDELICMFGAAGIRDISQYLRGIYSKNFDPHSFLKAARTNSRASQSLNSLIAELEENDQYQKRLLEVRGDANRRSEVIRTYLSNLENRAEALRSMTIKQLIDELPDADALFKFGEDDIRRKEDFKELSMEDVLSSPFFPLLRFLVSSGWIDESYKRYISNFYSDALSAEDDDFLSAIIQAKPADLTFKPKSPNEIIRRMDPGIFTRKSIRIPWIVSAVLDSEDRQKIDIFMSSVKRSGGVRYLAQFIASEQFNPKIFDEMFVYFDDPVADLLADNEIPVNDKRCFCKRYLTNGGKYFLSEKRDGKFTKYINKDPLFLERDPHFDDHEIEKGLLHVEYRAEAIDFSSASNTLLDYVYNNRLFLPVPSIIDGYLSFKYDINESMAHGTLITEGLKLTDDPIKTVILENMNYFISNVVEESRVPLRDDEKIVIYILNCKDIQAETAEIYIKALTDVEIEDITQVNSANYRNFLLSAQLVKCNARNIISFYQGEDNSISIDLAKLIETKNAPIDLNASICKELNVDETSIVSDIIQCEEISIENKRTILKECDLSFATFDVERLDDETVSAIISTNSIDMNGEMLDKFRLHKPNLTLNYILSNLDGFLSLINADSPNEDKRAIEKDEAIGLLGSNIDVNKKLDVLSHFNGTILLNKNYEDEVNAEIAAGHFDQDDITNLPSYYEKVSETYKDQIVEVFAKYSDTVIAENLRFSWNLLYHSLCYIKSYRVQTLHLLEWYFEKYGEKKDRDKVLKCFESANLEEYTKLIRGHQSMIPESDADDTMLSILTQLEMCGVISPSVNENGLRKVYPKGYKKVK